VGAGRGQAATVHVHIYHQINHNANHYLLFSVFHSSFCTLCKNTDFSRAFSNKQVSQKISEQTTIFRKI
jgi:hypothetical protein